MSELLETQNNEAETVLLVGVLLRGEEEWKVKDTMDELAQLSESAGAEVKGRFLVRQQKINASPRTIAIADDRNPTSRMATASPWGEPRARLSAHGVMSITRVRRPACRSTDR